MERTSLLDPPGDAGATVDPERFRVAMRRIAAPVYVVTTDGPAGRGGFTCTAFSSVADTPPTVLVCLNRNSRSALAFRQNGAFAVNVLGAADRPVADLFSGLDPRPVSMRFDAQPWQVAAGVPVLPTAMAWFACRTIEMKDLASHQVMIGQVIEVGTRPEGTPLFYHERHYRTLEG